jgi:hypothetical protein
MQCFNFKAGGTNIYHCAVKNYLRSSLKWISFTLQLRKSKIHLYYNHCVLAEVTYYMTLCIGRSDLYDTVY